MKRFLGAVLCLALLAMTGTWRAPVMVDANACAEPVQHCCQQHQSPRPAHTAPAPYCAQCPLLCCALLLPDNEAMATPRSHPQKWNLQHDDAVVRTERPPVPPPRWS